MKVLEVILVFAIVAFTSGSAIVALTRGLPHNNAVPYDRCKTIAGVFAIAGRC